MRALALIALTLASTVAAQSAGQRPAANPHRGGTLPSSDRDGTEPVIGRDARDLAGLFGDPRLDIHEGAGHKLQYANDHCILDAYLYAPREGAEAVVTHIDTRTLDGEATDRAECIRALRRR